MAYNHYRIPNLKDVVDLFSDLIGKLNTKFTAITTAINGKKASGASNTTAPSDKIQILKKLELDSDGNIVKGTGHTEYQQIAGPTPVDNEEHTSAYPGIVCLQDIIHDDEENDTNAVTPHAVSEAIKGFSSFVDASWILEKCDNYEPGVHTLIADIDGEGADEFTEFQKVMTAIQNYELVIGINADGTWVGTGYLSYDPHYPGATWIPLGLIFADKNVQNNYRLTFFSVSASPSPNIGYEYTEIEDSSTVAWSDITGKPDIPVIKHFPYQGTEHETDTLRLVGDGYYGTKVYCRDSTHGSNNDQLLGVLPPEPTHSGGLALMTDSQGRYQWQSPWPAYDPATDGGKVLMLTPHAAGGGNVYPDWTNNFAKGKWPIDVTDMTGAEALTYIENSNYLTYIHFSNSAKSVAFITGHESWSQGTVAGGTYYEYSTVFDGLLYSKRLKVGSNISHELIRTWMNEIVMPLRLHLNYAEFRYDGDHERGSTTYNDYSINGLMNNSNNIIDITSSDLPNDVPHGFITVNPPELYTSLGYNFDYDFTITIRNNSGHSFTTCGIEMSFAKPEILTENATVVSRTFMGNKKTSTNPRYPSGNNKPLVADVGSGSTYVMLEAITNYGGNPQNYDGVWVTHDVTDVTVEKTRSLNITNSTTRWAQIRVHGGLYSVHYFEGS